MGDDAYQGADQAKRRASSMSETDFSDIDPMEIGKDELGNTPHRCRFVIVTQPRSGSYHLASLLDSAPDITCLGEIYKPERVELPPRLAEATGFGPGDFALRDAHPEAYLAALLESCDSPVFGFKEFASRLTRTGIGKVTLRARRWQKVVLTRNPIRKYVSLHRARETGSFTKRQDGARPQDNAVVRFDPRLFEDVLAQDTRFRAGMQALKERRPLRVMMIDYREVNDTAKLAQVLGFIRSDADAASLQSSYFRQNPVALEDSIEDYAAMARYMSENGHEALLDDALHPDA